MTFDFIRNSQTETYKRSRTLKQHETEFILHCKKNLHKSFSGEVLDIGCATGSALSLIQKEYPRAVLTGIDVDTDLLRLARERLGTEASLISSTAEMFHPEKNYDLIIASGILSIFDDFSHMLKKWIDWLNPQGLLYVFGRFNSQNIDTLVRFRNLQTTNRWESGLNSYSLKTVSAFLDQLQVKYEFIRFVLNEDLPRSDDPIRTFTCKCEDGSRLVLNGANILAEHYHLILRKI
jgi:trans-aconitate methyltransferase